MYQNIIVPLDGSETAARALGPAVALADDYDGTVTLVSVVTPNGVASATETLRAQAAAAGIDDPEIDLLVSHRSPADHLLEALDTDPASLLCMATTGRSRLGQALGSVAEELLRARTGPFMLVGPECEPGSFKPQGRMVVTIDGSETGEEILPLASAWSIAYRLEPQVVMVVDPEVGAALSRATGGDTGAHVPVERAAHRMSQSIERPADWEVLHGRDVAGAIVDHAAEAGASAIAMTTHGRTGLPRVVLGSVAMEVVHRAPCPVLIHRPLRLRT